MLEFRLTPNHAGLVLWGDFDTLHRLHTFIHRIVEESCIISDKEGFILGLAYDVRKAYSGQRSEELRGDGETERYLIYGVEILWPVLIAQVGILRHAMSFIPNNKLDQAVMFELEYHLETAIELAMPGTAKEVIQWISRIGSNPYQQTDSVLNSRCRYFIGLPPKERLLALPKLLETFDTMYTIISRSSVPFRPGVIHPDVFIDDESDWPDFEW